MKVIARGTLIGVQHGINGLSSEPLGSAPDNGGGTGVEFRHGEGAPSNDLGQDGDYYLDTISAQLFYKSGGSYAVIADLGGSLPPGGSAGMVPFKNSGVDGDASWRFIQASDVVPTFEIASFTTPQASLVERGQTLSTQSVSASYTSGPPDSASVSNSLGGSSDAGDVAPGAWTINAPFSSGTMAGTIKRNGSNAGADPTWTRQLSVTKGAVNDTANVVTTWCSRLFFGFANDIDTEAEIETLSSALAQQAYPRTISGTPAGEYLNYVIPASYAVPVLRLTSGFEVPMDDLGIVALTNAYGVTRDYRHLRSEEQIDSDGETINVLATQS